MSTNRLASIVERLGDLPALPKTASEVLRITDEPTSDMGDVTRAIERDPALAAKILQVSNSSYYGMREYVGTLKLALVILGVGEVRNIVTGVSVFDALGREGDAAFNATLWDHSLFVAGIARSLDKRLQAGIPGEAFLAGLLHDIGKLALQKSEGGVYRAIAREYGTGLCDEEREAFGFTHADAGAALAEHWHFPMPLIDAIRYHHPGDGATVIAAKDPVLAAIVRIANLAAHDEHAATRDASLACADEDVWDALANAPAPIADVERFNVLREISNGLRAAPAQQQ